ncbi:MAG TPA: SIR2 family protein [Polyangium sp.]|nr:SIR2 family protein [Polyangium sp.]
MSGHLFIVYGDLTQLCCDAWLLPCDIDALPNPRWLKRFNLKLARLPFPAPTAEWRAGKQRAMKVAYWKDDLPCPWLANVGATSRTKTPWFIAGAREFVERAAKDLKTEQPKPRFDRAKHLLALPVVGTGLGGAHSTTGDVVRALVPELVRLASELDVDIALVSNDEFTFAAAQAQRGLAASAWPDLDAGLWAEGERLARIAANGNLVLFLGAGVSKNAGLPDWGGLLRNLAKGAGMSEAELEMLGDLGSLDQARAIELRMEANAGASPKGTRILGASIAEACNNVHGYAMTHALLAALPVREVVTTNYDTLFERASEAAGRTISVLPHDPNSEANRWLLKMHGCVTDPENIVLTREDYMRYDIRREALAGIVQALLLTRQMLFVGFSLRDDNFHRIADAVRRARMPSRRGTQVENAPVFEHFGTALALFSKPLEQSLWAKDLDWVTMEALGPPAVGDAAAGAKWANAARRLEIFLDSLLARTGTTRHLLNPRFDGALTDAERALATKVQRFIDDIEGDPEAVRAPAWDLVAELFQRLGRPRRP